jgi:hypothetical protein
MSTISTLKNKAETFVRGHETAITWLLFAVAIALILVAVFGKPEHKIMACLYIVL